MREVEIQPCQFLQLKILKRLGVTQEARSGFDEQASRCEPPLEKSELDTIWGSAVRFYNKTIKDSDDYIRQIPLIGLL